MKYNPEIHHRSSIRYPGYDYSSQGFYYITICTQDRECVFGDVNNGIMGLSDIGVIVHNEWLKTPIIRNNILLDEFVVMPNHFHAIFEITKTNTDKNCEGMGVFQYAPTSGTEHSNGIGFYSPSQTVGAIIRGFKSSTTKQINEHIGNLEHGSIWHRNFHDSIIKTKEHLENVRNYIRQNPRMWTRDSKNPNNKITP